MTGMVRKPNSNRTVLITGGSRGIGRSVALRFAETGAEQVIVNYVQDDGAAGKIKKEIERRGCRCHLVRANLQFPDEIERMFRSVNSVTDRIDSFIHCAALTAFKPLLDIKPNQWDMTMNINARGFLLCVQHVVPMMKEGSIVALSSLGSRRVVKNYGAMGPTKAALEAVVRYLAVELAERNIRVNAVSGGFVDTASVKKFPAFENVLSESVARTPNRRLGQPDDITDVVMFLVDPSARWICGQTLVADGGISIV